MFLSQIYVTGDYKTFLDHTLNWPTLFSDLNRIWSFSTSLVFKYQISRKSVHWESRWYTRRDGPKDTRTGGHDEANRRFPRLW